MRSLELGESVNQVERLFDQARLLVLVDWMCPFFVQQRALSLLENSCRHLHGHYRFSCNSKQRSGRSFVDSAECK